MSEEQLLHIFYDFIFCKVISLTFCFHLLLSVVFTDGVNVDWPGWCFDDDEVMDHLHPADEGLLEGISRTLAFWDVRGVFEQEDAECSQV